MASIPNPDNYLGHLSPNEAFQFEVARNLYIAVLGATIWDILVYIPDDIKILRMQKGIRVVNICFITSRVFALCYVLLSALAKTIPLDSCEPIFIAIGCCCILSISSSSFLFLRRVQAIWAGNLWVSGIFSVLWVLDWALEVTVPVGVHADHIPGTLYCIDSQPQHYVLAAGIIPVIFDTFVFLAISYKIAVSHSTLDVKISWGTLVSGKALPRLSRAILQGGQQYYLITAGAYIILTILLGLPSIPPIYRNINIKLLDLSELTMQLPVSDINFARNHPSLRYDPQLPYSTATQTMELQKRAKGSFSNSGTLNASSTTKSQSGWSEQPAELQVPERSLTEETKEKNGSMPPSAP
ncbi:hypothetical protein NP233_g1117 [Leucocoprinus birnbaumii]|uniref:Uncharacterized protein n=1 Tax=Leucocoprinus birnbaumii TaxID=56174 RepID=A0AAD5YZT1_9AGAR|nr:hypothetical protein NP233_g1117 [Leucocoprinus birnbaumii]